MDVQIMALDSRDAAAIRDITNTRMRQMRKHDGDSKQNTSDAVMQQRGLSTEVKDDFPTPPWATRAFIELVIGKAAVRGKSVLEPCANRGFMSEVLKEYFRKVHSFDAFDYGYCPVRDFTRGYQERSVDWWLTNPPFKLAEQFAMQGMRIATTGVALLTRLNFLGTQGRYSRLFHEHPPSLVAQYSERVPMVEGRYDPEASTATEYCWVIWNLTHSTAFGDTRFTWIPPCRVRFEHVWDALDPALR